MNKKILSNLQRGDIIIVDLGHGVGAEKRGIRPCIVLSKIYMSRYSDNIIVAPLTKSSNKQNEKGVIELSPTQVLLSCKYYKQLEYDSILQLEDIRSISKDRIGKYLGYCSIYTQEEINIALNKMLSN